jgi:myo-inositol-1(or 4)-monophosphatase
MTVSREQRAARLPPGASALAHRLADVARGATLAHFRGDALAVENKAGGRVPEEARRAYDPVTEADRGAEREMRAILEAERPEDAIQGEEYGARAGTSGFTWVLDPVDGTRAFVAGAPTWGVLIALSDPAGPCLGVIDQPYIGERFWGGIGIGAAMDGPLGTRPLSTRPSRPLHEAICMTTFPELGTPEEAAAFRSVAQRCRLTRYGLDCYAYALVAAGHVDLVIEAGLQPHDIAAPIAVIEAAGGIVTDWRGRPAHGGGRVVAAASEQVHAEALELLSRAPG